MENRTKKLPRGVLSAAARKLGMQPSYVWQVVYGNLQKTKSASKVLCAVEECIKEAESRRKEIALQHAELLRKYAN